MLNFQSVFFAFSPLRVVVRPKGEIFFQLDII